MNIDFYLKKGDTAPGLKIQLSDRNGYLNLSTVTGAKFAYELRENSTGVTLRDMTLFGPSSGVITYDWQTGETNTPGIYQGEIVLNYSGGKQATFPNDKFLTFEIVDDIS